MESTIWQSTVTNTLTFLVKFHILKNTGMSYSDWVSFNRENIRKAPTKAGVYFLGSEHETTYIGAADNIQQRLEEHINSSDSCIKRTISFCYHETLFPEAEEEKQLTAFQYEHGRLPLCNKSR